MQKEEAYKIFMSYRLHFEGRFNIGSGRKRITLPKKFNDVLVWSRLATIFNTENEGILRTVSAFLHCPSLKTPHDIVEYEEEYTKQYNNFIKRDQSFVYYYKEEMQRLLPIIKESYRFKDWLYGGGILYWYMEKKISIETMATLQLLFNFLEGGVQVNLFDTFYGTFFRQYIMLGREKSRYEALKSETEQLINDFKRGMSNGRET